MRTFPATYNDFASDVAELRIWAKVWGKHDWGKGMGKTLLGQKMGRNSKWPHLKKWGFLKNEDKGQQC